MILSLQINCGRWYSLNSIEPYMCDDGQWSFQANCEAGIYLTAYSNNPIAVWFYTPLTLSQEFQSPPYPHTHTSPYGSGLWGTAIVVLVFPFLKNSHVGPNCSYIKLLCGVHCSIVVRTPQMPFRVSTHTPSQNISLWSIHLFFSLSPHFSFP